MEAPLCLDELRKVVPVFADPQSGHYRPYAARYWGRLCGWCGWSRSNSWPRPPERSSCRPVPLALASRREFFPVARLVPPRFADVRSSRHSRRRGKITSRTRVVRSRRQVAETFRAAANRFPVPLFARVERGTRRPADGRARRSGEDGSTHREGDRRESVHIPRTTRRTAASGTRPSRKRWGTSNSFGSGSPYAIAPGRVRKQDGTPFKVFTPFRNAWLDHGWRKPADTDASTVDWIKPGHGAELPAIKEELPDAMKLWEKFRDERLQDYDTTRDRPDMDATSRMSAFLQVGRAAPADAAPGL